jgi:hypothetical protein
MTVDTFYNMTECPLCGGRKMRSSVHCKKCHMILQKTLRCVNQVKSRMFPLEWCEYD